ncbi:MAG: hypothetical protein KJP00_03100, partial [Bacteroidia bacterium]|nr:hypothetical protein [Bacteroidia bacterium]
MRIFLLQSFLAFFIILSINTTASANDYSLGLTIDPGPPQVACAGDNISLGTSPLATGGTPPYAITWHVLGDTSNHSGLSDPYIEEPTFLLSTDIVYGVLVEDAMGEICSSQIIIQVNKADAGPNQFYCPSGVPIELGVSAIPDGNLTYDWYISGNPGQSTGLNDPSIARALASPSVTTDYVLSKSHINGCIDRDTVRVTVSLNSADAGIVSQVCLGSMATLGNVSNPGNYTYHWTDPYGFLDDTENPNPIFTPTYVPDTNPINVYLTATSDEGCIKMDTLSITIQDVPDLSNRIVEYCGVTLQAGIDLPSEIGNAYNWSVTGNPGDQSGISDPSIQNPFISIANSYTVTVTNIIGCADSLPIEVVASCSPGAENCIVETKLCKEISESVYIGIDTGDALSFSWSPTTGLSDPSSSETWANPPLTTTYTLTVDYGDYECDYEYFVNVAPFFIKDSDKVICTNSSITIGSNGLPGFSYSWSPSENLSNASVDRPDFLGSSDPGFFRYIVTGTHSSFFCETVDTIIIEVRDNSANAGSDMDYCQGSTISIGSSPNPNTTYSWSPDTYLDNPGISQPMSTPEGNITYTLTTLDTLTGCLDVATITLTEIADISADANGPMQNICNGGGVILGGPDMSSMGYTYSWTPTAGLSDPSSANPIASPSTATTYTLTVQSPGAGCFDSDTVHISIDTNLAPTANAGSNQENCEGLSVSLGTPLIGGLTYSWIPADHLDDPNVAQPTATVTSESINYILEVTDGGGCKAFDQVTVSPSFHYVDPGTDQSICAGSPTSIGEAPEAGYSYLWSPSSGLDNPTSSNPTATISNSQTYTVTKFHLASTCFVIDSVRLSVNPLPDNDAGMDQDICSTPISIGPSIPNGSYSYQWSPNTGLSDTQIANPNVDPSVLTSTTTYFLTVTDNSTLCSNTGQVTIRPEVIREPFSDTVFVCQDSVMIGMNAQPNYLYSWSPVLGLNNASISSPKSLPDSSTSYTVAITNTITGCIDSTKILVEIENIRGWELEDLIVCQDSNTIIGITNTTISGQYVNWSWTPNSGLSAGNIPAPELIAPSVNQTFTVQAEHWLTGCVISENFTVYVDDQQGVYAEAGSDKTICNGATATIGTTAQPGLRYRWNPIEGISDFTIAQPAVSPSRTTTYTVTVTDPVTNCTAVDQVTITIDDLGIYAGSDLIVCKYGTAQLEGTDLGPGFIYKWSPAYGLDNPNIPNPLAYITTTTTFTLEATEISTGCTSTDKVVITVSDTEAPIKTAGIDRTICNGESIEIGPQDDGFSTYSWTPSVGLSDTSAPNPLASPTATTIYSLTIHTGDCISQSSITVTVEDDFVVNAGPDIQICQGETISIGSLPEAGLSYHWSPSIGLSDPNISNPIANPASSTIYTLTVLNANGCRKTDIVEVVVNANPISFSGNSLSICEESSVQLGTNALVGKSYRWSPITGLNNANIPNPVANPESTTTYWITMTDDLSGCNDSSAVTVTIENCNFECPSLDSLTFSANSICSGEEFNTTIHRSQNIGSLSLFYNLVSDGLLTESDIYSMDHGGAMVIDDSISLTESIVINEITYWGGDTIELWNVGHDTVDISSWWFCSRFDYGQVSSMNLESGSLMLVPGKYAVLTGFALDDASADLGLYNSFDFSNPEAMVDFIQYGTDGIGRESVASVKGIWTAGTFIPFVSQSGNSISYDGSGNDPSNWMEESNATYGNDNTNQSQNVGTTYSNIPLPENNTGAPIDYYIYAALGKDNSMIPACSLLTSAIITVNPIPTVTITEDQIICSGDTASLSVAGGVSYMWTPTFGLSDPSLSNTFAYPDTNTIYYVDVTDANGCISRDSLEIMVLPVPDLMSTPGVICSGESIDLNNLISDSNGLTGTMQFYNNLEDAIADTNTISSVVSPTVFTTFYALKNTATAPSCDDIVSVDIDVKIQPSLLGSDTDICVGTFVDLSA